MSEVEPIVRFRQVLWEEMTRQPVKVAEILLRYVLNLPVEKEIVLNNGYQARMVLPSPVAAWAYLKGDFDPEITDYIYQTVAPGMVAFDVGAHFGIKTAFLKEAVGDKGRVISFEPSPATFQILEVNSRRWNTEPQQIALSDSVGVVQMRDFGWKHSDINTLGNPRWHRSPRSRQVQVQTTTLDQFVSETGIVPNIVKIDAENSERAILAGSVQTLKRHKVEVIFEAGNFGRKDGQKTEDCLSLLEELGYRTYELCKGGNLMKIRSRWGPTDGANLLASPMI
ncbi:FkbM family methyltransferase [Candidatus Daviesbacteria bacterium]|nr:FkbM family methyltransferase [Candidatus Daviesbacteria bacterium]